MHSNEQAGGWQCAALARTLHGPSPRRWMQQGRVFARARPTTALGRVRVWGVVVGCGVEEGSCYTHVLAGRLPTPLYVCCCYDGPRYYDRLARINEYEPALVQLSDEQLQAKTGETDNGLSAHHQQD